jgi:integration host factor subunit alpha
MTLTKSGIVDLLCSENGCSRKDAVGSVEILVGSMKRSLASGEDVLVSGFGKFVVKSKKERKGRNPVTGGDIMLEPRRVVTFKCSGKLRDKIKGRLVWTTRS